MISEADAIRLFDAVKEMRKAQRHYAQDREEFNLMAARSAEKKVDDILVELRIGSRDTN